MGKSRQKHRRAAAERLASTQAAAGHVERHWPALSGLRGLAACGVLFLHVYILAGAPASVPAPLAWLFAIGWSGVDVFFTLSAFLLAMPFVAARSEGLPEPSLRSYWRNRAWRILPAYYVQLALLFVFALAGARWAGYWQGADARSLAVNALFLYNLVPLAGPAIPPWWTLPVELGFYLLLPWFARLLTPARLPWLLLAILASLAWRWWLLGAGLARAEEVAWVEHLPGRLHQFVIGMLAAWAFVRWRGQFQHWSPAQRDLVAGLAAALFLALPALSLPVDGLPYGGSPSASPLLFGWHLLASLLVAAMLVALASGPSRLGRLLAAGWLQALGLVSYSLYLWHYPVLLALREALGGMAAVGADFWPFAFYSVLFSLLLAGASWWLVERPAQRRAGRDKITA